MSLPVDEDVAQVLRSLSKVARDQVATSIDAIHLLLAILSDETSAPCKLLNELKVTRAKVEQVLAKQTRMPSELSRLRYFPVGDSAAAVLISADVISVQLKKERVSLDVLLYSTIVTGDRSVREVCSYCGTNPGAIVEAVEKAFNWPQS